jgi:hypothetical protein
MKKPRLWTAGDYSQLATFDWADGDHDVATFAQNVGVEPL